MRLKMKTAFVFSGQGSQYNGMGKELYEKFDVCRAIFDKADEALGFSIKDIMWNESPKLNETEYTQPAIFTMSMACFELLRSKSINADCYAGFSLGEYSAICASGVFSFEDGVRLVNKRGKFMTSAVPQGVGAMSAIIGLETEVLEEVCKKASNVGLVICANYNMPGQIVIAGEALAIEKAEKLAQEAGAKRVIRLNVSGPFHTRLLEPASVNLYNELLKMELHKLEKPVFTNLTGKAIGSDDIREVLRKQVMSPVLWETSIKEMISCGVTTFVELGPGKTLSGFIKKIDKSVNILNIEDIKSFEKVVESLC